MICVGEHRFDWTGEHWTCLECGQDSPSTDPQIAPCVSCGAAVDSDEVYCLACTNGVFVVDPRQEAQDPRNPARPVAPSVPASARSK